MGIPTPRHRRTTCSAPLSSNGPKKKQCVYWGPRRASITSVPTKDASSPRTLERKTIQKESVANLFSELRLAPGPFCLHHVKSAQKDWKLRAAALQSTQARKICRNLHKRKQLVRRFTVKAGFSDIFKKTERSKADEEHRFSLETALSYSPVELVARNLIDKVANDYQRQRHGVWSQLGRPYSCLGLPATTLPREHPNPRNLEHFGATDGISPFFVSTIRPASRKVSMAGAGPILIKKSDLLVEGSRSQLNLQCLLLKMGLSHLHDETHTRFPRKPLEVSDQLRKSVRVNTPFSLVMHDKDPSFPSSGSFGQQSIHLTDFRGSPWQRLGASIPQIDGATQGNIQVDSAPPTKDAQQGLELPKIGQEVSSKLLEHVRESCSSQSPILTHHMWRHAEENQSKKRPASAPHLPEVESISNFYERVCLFVSNQRDDDSLMEVLVHHLKELLESGFKLQKELLSSLCYYMAHLPDHILCTGRMSSVMPILYFICKELRVPSTDYYMLLKNSGLDRFQGNNRNVASSPSNQ